MRGATTQHRSGHPGDHRPCHQCGVGGGKDPIPCQHRPPQLSPRGHFLGKNCLQQRRPTPPDRPGGACSPPAYPPYLLMDLLRGLRVTKGHRGHVLQDGHLHRAVPAVQQRHQGPGVHGPIHDRRSDACNDSAGRSAPCWDPSPPAADIMQSMPRTSSSVRPLGSLSKIN